MAEASKTISMTQPMDLIYQSMNSIILLKLRQDRELQGKLIVNNSIRVSINILT